MNQMELAQRSFLDIQRRWNADEKGDFGLLEVLQRRRSAAPCGLLRRLGSQHAVDEGGEPGETPLPPPYGTNELFPL